MNKKKILYIGNKLSKHGFTPTTIETLGEKLKDDFQVYQVSDKKNKIFRLIDIWFTLIFRRKPDLTIIDTYSTYAFIYAFTSAFLLRMKGVDYFPILHGGNIPKKLANFLFYGVLI